MAGFIDYNSNPKLIRFWIYLTITSAVHQSWSFGELILAKLAPCGCEELSRAKLLPTLSHNRGRDVLWCHPACAHRRAYVHNGQELLCVSFAPTNAPRT